jgi:DNA-binding transcriptional MerR regulator
MNISQLARAADVTPDTLRYYEKQGLLATAARQSNGYRHYSESDLKLVRFIRGAQSLGFSLAEIRAILPQLAEGQFGRAEIEQQLHSKMAQIDAHISHLHTLKQELQATMASLRCQMDQPLAVNQSTATDSGSGAGVAVLKTTFVRQT